MAFVNISSPRDLKTRIRGEWRTKPGAVCWSVGRLAATPAVVVDAAADWFEPATLLLLVYCRVMTIRVVLVRVEQKTAASPAHYS